MSDTHVLQHQLYCIENKNCAQTLQQENMEKKPIQKSMPIKNVLARAVQATLKLEELAILIISTGAN